MKLPSIQSRALKYGYANSRVKAMKGLLIDQSSLDEMIRVKSIEGMIELFQRTSYKGDFLAEAGTTGSETVEIASARNFSKTVGKIVKFTPKSDCPAVNALLRKWEILNIKTIIHAKEQGMSYREVKPYLFNIGGLSDSDVERLMKAEGDELFNELKKTELGKEMLSVSTANFSKHMRDTFNNALKNMNTFLQAESIIDAYAYLFMDKGLSQVGGKEIESIRRIMKKEIDAKNILIVERLKKYNFGKDEIKKYLIKGGTLRPSFVDKLIDAPDRQLTISLIKSRFRKLEVKEDPKLVDLEIALEKALAAEKTAIFHRSILSIGVVLGFILLKETEMHNVRKVAKAKEFNIPEQEVRDMLVVV